MQTFPHTPLEKMKMRMKYSNNVLFINNIVHIFANVLAKVRCRKYALNFQIMTKDKLIELVIFASG